MQSTVPIPRSLAGGNSGKMLPTCKMQSSKSRSTFPEYKFKRRGGIPAWPLLSMYDESLLHSLLLKKTSITSPLMTSRFLANPHFVPLCYTAIYAIPTSKICVRGLPPSPSARFRHLISRRKYRPFVEMDRRGGISEIRVPRGIVYPSEFLRCVHRSHHVNVHISLALSGYGSKTFPFVS